MRDCNNRSLYDVLGDTPMPTPSPRYDWADSTYRNDGAPSVALSVDGEDTVVSIYFENDLEPETGETGCTVYREGYPVLNFPLTDVGRAMVFACGLAEAAGVDS